MPTYEFVSVRGHNFIIDGADPQDAWKNLVEREKDNGSLWKTSDDYCNKCHVENLGFSYLTEDHSPAYKRISK